MYSNVLTFQLYYSSWYRGNTYAALTGEYQFAIVCGNTTKQLQLKKA